MDKKRQRLQMQLEQLAGEIPSQKDEELLESALASSGALLRLAEQIAPGGLSEAKREEIYAGYLGLAGRIVHFYRENKEAVSGTGTADDGVFRELEKILDDIGKRQTALQDGQRQLGEARRKNDLAQQKLDECRKQLEQEEEREARLKKKLDECSPEQVEKRRVANAKLSVEVASKRETLAELEKEERGLVADLDEANREIALVQEKIRSMPEENRRLLERHQELSTLLEELRRAKTDCSVERQEQLQKEIDLLLPQVEELQVATETLTNRLASLRQQHTVFDEKRQTLETDVLDVLHGSLAELEKLLAQHGEALQEVKRKADTLSGSLEDCRKLREQYQGWLDADRTPLETMAAVLPYPESETLRSTFDVGKVSSVQTLLGQTRQNLEELDRILADCARAAGEDQERVRRRAHP